MNTSVAVQSGRIGTEGDDLYYEVRGCGRPLLMIPPAGGDGWHYSNVADILASEYKVITFDRRANARSTINFPQTGTIAGACRYGTLHLWADRALFEVYSPRTATAAPTGAGQLVVTPLHRKAMPLLRYNLEDDVEIDDAACACGWHLPTVRVYGRTGFGYKVGQITVTQPGLEELVFGLPADLGVLFWRARAELDRLFVEIEVCDDASDTARGLLAQAIDTAYGVPSEVTTVPTGTVVSNALLIGAREGAKPRNLFGPGEDWTAAIVSS